MDDEIMRAKSKHMPIIKIIKSINTYIKQRHGSQKDCSYLSDVVSCLSTIKQNMRLLILISKRTPFERIIFAAKQIYFDSRFSRLREYIRNSWRR